MSMKLINPEFQVSKSKNKKVIKVCFGTHSSGTPCIMDVVTNAFQSERENLNLHYLNYDNFYQSSTKMH